MDWSTLLKDAPTIIVLIALVGGTIKLILALTDKFFVHLTALDERQAIREKENLQFIREQGKCLASLESKTIMETKVLEKLAEEVKDTKYAIKELHDAFHNN